MSNPIKSYWVHHIEDLQEDTGAWSKLASLQTHPIFHNHTWFTHVLQWQADGIKPLFWVAKVGPQLKAIVPLAHRTQTTRGIKHQSLEWLRVPDSPVNDFILCHEDKPRYIRAFFQALIENAPKWDKMSLYPFEQQTAKILQTLTLPIAHTLNQTSQHYWINLESSFEDYYQTRSRRLKKANNYIANKIKANGKIEIINFSTLSPAELANKLEIITMISHRSWKQQTATTLDNSGPQRFFESLTAFAAKNEQLWLWLLRVDKQPIAYEYQLTDPNSVYALRSDFLPEYKDLSPGSYLNWKIIEHLFDSNKKAYFMGPGENAYKTRWNNQTQPIYTFHGYAPSFKGKLLKSLDSMVSHIRNNQTKNCPEEKP